MNLQIEKIGQRLGHSAAVYCLDVFDHGFLSAGGDGMVVQWWWTEVDGRALARLDENIFALLFLPDHGVIVVGAFSGNLYVIDLDRPEEPRRFDFHQGGIFALTYVAPYLVVGGGDGKVSFWDPASWQIVESVALSHQSIRDIHLIEDQEVLLVSTSDGGIYFLSVHERRVVDSIATAHQPSVFVARWDATHQRIVSGGRDAKLRSWQQRDKGMWSEEMTIDAHWYTINDLVLLHGDAVWASASRDKTIRFWKSDTLGPIATVDRIQFAGHANSVNRLLWIEELSYLVSTGDDRQILIWQVTDDVSPN